MKQDDTIPLASDNTVELFKEKKRSYDPITGLNLFDDERLIRSREAMYVAVQVFNNPSVKFKTETFCVMAIIAWTYLLHEYYVRSNINIVNKQGKTFSLSYMLRRNDCPLRKGVIHNLEDMIEIRDAVEHKLFARADKKFFPLFQACCLNFDNSIRELFGESCSLRNDLDFALQFAKLDIEQISVVQDFDIPSHISSLDSELTGRRSEEEINDLEYRFRVVYTLESAPKSQAHIRFINPNSEEGKEIRHVLVKHKPSDQLYPYKPSHAAALVAERSGRHFSLHLHTKAWKKYRVRPPSGSPNPDQTDPDYCTYNSLYKSYSYSDAWIDFLVAEIATDSGYNQLKNFTESN
ncbi:uncharacterized protein DUF3644 [Dichotomicrobium thermohalophilum]|uniref:Uncharacterized protein DUF3644 n=1 Tax=Dichotomicrobium thermohalophilum TaxID=933063 RepID=A0A397PJK1_9HYPH|nr:uncharacterized protein DUF3644 [Dichotomicrobium thermohalophilum]